MVKAGDAYLKATRLPEDPAPLFSFGHFSVTDDQWTHGYLTSGVRRILSDPEYAQSLNITPDQHEATRIPPPAPATRWPKETQGRLADLYKKWESAPTAQKPAAANDLITTLRQQAQTRRNRRRPGHVPASRKNPRHPHPPATRKGQPHPPLEPPHRHQSPPPPVLEDRLRPARIFPLNA